MCQASGETAGSNYYELVAAIMFYVAASQVRYERETEEGTDG